MSRKDQQELKPVQFSGAHDGLTIQFRIIRRVHRFANLTYRVYGLRASTSATHVLILRHASPPVKNALRSVDRYYRGLIVTVGMICPTAVSEVSVIGVKEYIKPTT